MTRPGPPTCAICNAALTSGTSFCSQCGTPVPDEILARFEAESIAGDKPEHEHVVGGQQALDGNDRTWGTLVHLSSLLGLIIPFPFVNVIAPLVIWMMFRDESEFIDFHGKEALNFQISLLIYIFVGVILGVILALVLIGFLILAVIPFMILFGVIAVIVAAVKANHGIRWEYPVSMRFIK